VHIAYGGRSAKNELNMNKLNGSANMNKNAGNLATNLMLHVKE